MEPPLIRMLAKLGMHWSNMGPLIEFHGKRQPCYTVISDMLDGMLRERPDIWQVFTNGGAYVPDD
jgi:N-acyl amino acid synthase of PEP-CTERM/exosortase system